MSDDDREMLRPKRSRRVTEANFLVGDVLHRAEEQFDKILFEELSASPMLVPPPAKRNSLETALQKLNLEAEFYGRRFREAKSNQSNDLKFVGSVGGRGVFMADLPGADKSSLVGSWTGAWDRAFEPWKTEEGTRYWRAGGALFTIENPATAALPKKDLR